MEPKIMLSRERATLVQPFSMRRRRDLVAAPLPRLPGQRAACRDYKQSQRRNHSPNVHGAFPAEVNDVMYEMASAMHRGVGTQPELHYRLTPSALTGKRTSTSVPAFGRLDMRKVAWFASASALVSGSPR